MDYNDEQKGILHRYTDDIEEVTQIPQYEYERASSKKVSKILDDYHVLWFHDDPQQMHLIKK